MNGEFRTITLLITEFYCVDFTDLIMKITRFVLYSLTSIIIIRFNYEVAHILDYY